jgi:antitoxin ParD1/3/4
LAYSAKPVTLSEIDLRDSAMPTRNVVLTDQQAELVHALVQSGRYQNASEVLREGLRLLQRREREDAARLESIRGALDEAEAAVASGDVWDYSSSLLDEIRQEDQTGAQRPRR